MKKYKYEKERGDTWKAVAMGLIASLIISVIFNVIFFNLYNDKSCVNKDFERYMSNRAEYVNFVTDNTDGLHKFGTLNCNLNKNITEDCARSVR